MYRTCVADHIFNKRLKATEGAVYLNARVDQQHHVAKSPDMGGLVIDGFEPNVDDNDYNYEDIGTQEMLESYLKSLARSINKQSNFYKLISPFVDIVFVVQNPVRWALNCAANELNQIDDEMSVNKDQQRGTRTLLKFINIYILMMKHYEYYVDNYRNAYVMRVEDLDDRLADNDAIEPLWFQIHPDAREQVKRTLKKYKFIARLGYDGTETIQQARKTS